MKKVLSNKRTQIFDTLNSYWPFNRFENELTLTGSLNHIGINQKHLNETSKGH